MYKYIKKKTNINLHAYLVTIKLTMPVGTFISHRQFKSVS